VGNRSVPDYPFFRKPHVSAVGSFFDIKLKNINIRSLRGEGVVRRDSGSFQFPLVTLTGLEFLLVLINCHR